jgi:hypothetical protein
MMSTGSSLQRTRVAWAAPPLVRRPPVSPRNARRADPEALTPGEIAERHIYRALVRRASPFRTWLATEMWRAGTLWRCEKVAYRLAVRGSPTPLTRIAVWGARVVRLPILAVSALVILARGAWLLGAQAEPLSSRAGARTR